MIYITSTIRNNAIRFFDHVFKVFKKMTLLRENVKQNPNYMKGQKVMFALFVTRWVENSDGFLVFLTTFPLKIQTLGIIDHQLQLEIYPEWRDWDLESKLIVMALLGYNHCFYFSNCKIDVYQE